jgi:hypothetical protein
MDEEGRTLDTNRFAHLPLNAQKYLATVLVTKELLDRHYNPPNLG